LAERLRHATKGEGNVMRSSVSLVAAGGLGLLLLAAGCGDSNTGSALPTSTSTQTTTSTPRNAATTTGTATATVVPSVTPTPTRVPCATGALVAPILQDPPMWGIVDSLTPSLRWSYPDPTCNPEGYRIRLSTGPFFSDQLDGGTGNPSTSWGPAAPLEPGREYAWAVQAINGTTLGPIAGNQYFFTGPSCDVDALKAPQLRAPEDNAVISDELAPSLIWEYPDACVPGGYRVDLSTSLDFDDSPLNGGTGTPSTRWGPGQPLIDCTRYYWRTAAITGVQLGPYSEVHTFRVAVSPDCPAEVP
jgi:hypothetical protein